jgi:hypothetical protein
MICSPDGVVMGFPGWAIAGVAIAAPPEMTASVNTAELREHIGIVLPPLRARDTKARSRNVESDSRKRSCAKEGQSGMTVRRKVILL